jgi:hypothetical protein
VLDAVRNDQELARAEEFFSYLIAIAIFHRDFAFDNQKEFVFGIVVMPNELTIDFYDFHVKVVELADDLRLPRFIEERELLVNVHFSKLAQADTVS